MEKVFYFGSHFLCTAIILLIVLYCNTPAQDYGLNFNGTNQYITTTLDAQPSALPTTTWEAWIKTSNISKVTWQTIFSTDNGGWDRGVWIHGDNTIVIGYGTDGWIPPITVNANTWYHIAVIFKPDNVLFYLNGFEYSLGQAPAGQETDKKLSIGDKPGHNLFFQGDIDEVRIWNTARSQTQIQGSMNTELNGTESNLVAYYRMNEGSGTATTTDNSGHGYTGTLNNSPAWVPGAALNTYITGLLDYALAFRGQDQYINCGNVVVTDANPRTVEAWVYTRSFNNGGIWQMGTQSSNNEFSLRTLDTDNEWRVQLWGDDVDINLTGSKDAWSHFALVYDGANIKLYYNGELVVDQAKSINTLSANFFIGKWSSDYFYGMIDEVRVWSVARTQDEIRSTMNTKLSGSESNLTAYYKMDDGSGSTINDNTTASTYDGTLYNSPGWVSGAYQPAGSGASGDEYQLSNLNNLYWLSSNSSKWNMHYKQTADIDASFTEYWNSGSGWSSVGQSSSSPFSGSYNGQGYIISGLYLNRSASDDQGFFGEIDHYSTAQTTIQNIHLINVNITGYENVGALAGHVYYRTTIENCSSTGNVIGNMHVGGLIGNCQDINNSSIYVRYSYSACNVAAWYAGGLIGYLKYRQVVSNCYTVGNVFGTQFSGGIFELVEGGSFIDNCYSAGHVVGQNQGGIAGDCYQGRPDMTNSYFDIGTTNQWYTYGNDNNTTTGQTSTTDMKTQSNYLNWDFSTTWARDDNKNGGYPYLRWQTFPYTISITDGSAFSLTPALGQVNQPIGSFGLHANSAGASLYAVWVKLNGTRTGATNFKLWESSDNTFNAGSDTPIGLTYSSDPGTGNNIWFTGLNIQLLTTDKYYFLTCDLASNATGSIQPVITGNKDLMLGFGMLGTTIENVPLSAGAILFPALPIVTTQEANNITTSGATAHGNITYLGFPYPTQYGVCWSTSANPTIADSHSELGQKNETGAYSSVITGLNLNTKYYVRAYATNTEGTSYGGQVEFTTLFAAGNAVLFKRDNKNYISASPPVPQSGPYTIEAWIKPNLMGSESYPSSNSIRPGIIGWGEYAASDAVNAFRLTPDGLCNYWWNAGDLTVTTGDITGTWHQVTAAYDGTTKCIYLDGNLAGSSTPSVSYNTRGNSYFAIGRTNYGVLTKIEEYFDGQIDEVRIYNICKDLSQIRRDMHLSLSGTEAGLTSYWNLNEGTGTATANQCGTGSGTLTNFLMNGTDGWVTSTAPLGAGTSASINAFTSGTAELANVTVAMTNSFDYAVDIFCTEIFGAPRQLPSGFSSAVGNRYFILKAYGTPGTFAANLTFTMGAGVLDSRDDAYPGGVKLYRRDSNSDGEWSLVGGAASANSSTGVVTFNNITQFSQFVLIEDESALPVELSSFTASAEDNKVTLKWKTETEVDNYGFEIERSRKSEIRSQNSEIRNVEWEKVGFVEGAGNSNSPKEYSFIDDLNHNLNLTRLTYRLKQIDTDGSFKYSDEVEVDVKLIPTEFALAQNYPNPFNPVTVISWQLPVSSKVMLKIYDILGNEVSILVNEEQAAGNYEVKFDGSNLSSGIYYYRIQAANFVNTRKLILLK